MSRRRPSYVVIASAAIVIAALLAIAPGNRNAAGSDVEFVWGNWRCVADPMSTDNAITILRYVAEMEKPSTIGCSPFNEIVVDDIHGNLLWGDTNCDGIVDAQDALAQFLWYADLTELHASCPALGDAIVEPTAEESDWEVAQVDYDVPAITSGAVISSQGRVDVTVQAGNRGPDQSSAGLFLGIDIPASIAAIRFIPLSGDLCFDLTPQQIPCSEGNLGSDPTVDLCLDGVDNDGDQLEDFDDPDCGQNRTLRQSILLAPGPDNGTYERSFTIFCTVEGPVNFDIHVRVEPAEGVTDPDLSNNALDHPIAIECVS
jgi:hypothetical protein